MWHANSARVTNSMKMNYAGERGALLAGVQREYPRRDDYLAHLDAFLDGL